MTSAGKLLLSTRSRRRVAFLARRWMLFAAALALPVMPGCKGDADFSDAMPTPVVLPAEDYRPEITAIDRLVFEERPLTDARREELAKALEALGKRIRTANDSAFIKLEALEIRRFASGTRDYPADAPPDAMRNNWMRIRSNVFDDREWFARSAKDLPQSIGIH